MKQKMYSCDARVILSILIGLFLSCNVFAQDVTIKGNVKDAKGEPIIGLSLIHISLVASSHPWIPHDNEPWRNQWNVNLYSE